MKAIVCDNGVHFVSDYPAPELRQGWALIRVRLAGICQTDLEVVDGYRGFRGILGHEFVGRVEQCEDQFLLGERVVGEINAACGDCSWCAAGLGRHCPQRVTMGINGLDGCMAEFCTLPIGNLHPVDAAISDRRAVLTEPLAAACEILEQVVLTGAERVVVLGDGRLGVLCAWVLATVAAEVTIVGHHPEKLALAGWRGIKTVVDGAAVASGADIVIEATGRTQGLARALSLCRPRGTIVLKTTVARPGEIDLAPLVVKEITMVGSRCGRFTDALAMLSAVPELPLERLISACHSPADARQAFARAGDGRAVKVLFDFLAQ
ncbi:MAG: alcohol dehydrogenase catalytic domain-containing protein [Desulfobulbaceae bacterium]|nr:alcohol dehydrogenase catalytic domain-containing protein [Desulfobulbaceae bacterium]